MPLRIRVPNQSNNTTNQTAIFFPSSRLNNLRDAAEGIKPLKYANTSGSKLTAEQQEHIRNGRLPYTGQVPISQADKNLLKAYQEEISIGEDGLTTSKLVANYALRATENNNNFIGFVVKRDENNSIQDNPLNEYINTQYHITFSIVSQKEAIRFQKEGYTQEDNFIDPIERKVTNEAKDNSVVIASTGENQTTGGRNYYNILSYQPKVTMEPTSANPLVSTMIEAKIKIIEPFGFKFYEDMQDAAIQLGYEKVNYGRYVFKTDLWFSGYDKYGEYIEKIDISGEGKNVTNLTTYVSITSFEANVTNTGTEYEIGLVPLGHHAYRPEDIILDGATFNTGAVFRDFLDNLQTTLNEAKRNRTNDQIIRNYEFYAPELIERSAINNDSFKHSNKKLFTSVPGNKITIGKNVDLLMLLRGTLANIQEVQELFIADDNNDSFITPRVHFAIRFNTIYGTRADENLNDYKEITHQYIIEPYVTFKYGPLKKSNVNEYVSINSQTKRIQEIVRLGMMKKIYNYLYTEENTEVIDMSVKLQPFFYYSLDTLDINDASPGRLFDSRPASESDTSRVEENIRINSEETQQDNPAGDDVFIRIFGTRNPTVGSITNGWRRLGGAFNESSDVGIYGDTAADPNGRRYDYELYMEDYLTADLLQLNGLKIRGDPTWLFNPYSSYDINDFVNIEGLNNAGNSRNVLNVKPRLGQIIFLKILAPDQNDLQNMNRQRATNSRSIIGGFYQITTVESDFSEGKFTQTIEGVKLNHLNYIEDSFQEKKTS